MKKILAIDDKQDNLTTIKAVIKNNMPDCKVLTALSGKEGIETARMQQPDTILLDIIMPHMDGYEVCKRLKEDESTKHIPVIMLTAIKTDSESRVRGLNTGADAFLSKPIDSIELTAQVNVMLRIKEAEDKLRKERDELDILVEEKTKEIKYQAAVLENVSDPVISIDMDYKIKSWNEAAEKLYGWKEKEVLGKTFRDVMLPEYPNSSREEAIKELFTTGYFISEVVHHKKDGNRLDISGSVSFMNDDEGNPYGIVSVNHDITERKEAEVKLAFQASLFEQISNAIITIDFDNTILSWNKHAEELYYWTSKEAIGQDIIKLLSPNEMKSEVLVNFENLNSDGHWEGEFDVKRKDGTTVPVYITNTYLTDIEGKNIGFIGISFNIEKRRQMEEKLLKNQFHLTRAQEIGNMGAWELDLQNNILLWTKENYKIFGVPENTDMTYELFLDCIHPDDRDFVDKKWKTALHHEPYDIEHRLLVNNEVKWVREKADVEFDSDGKAVRAIGVTQDISYRITTEDKLKESEERLRQITENSQEWIWEVDVNGLYTHVSPVMEELLGYKIEEIVGKKHFYDLFHPEDKEEMKNAAFDVFKQKLPFRDFTNRNLTKNGEIIWLITSGVPILDKDGNLLGYRGGDIDITKRIKAEEELLKHKEKLEEIVEERTKELKEKNEDLERMNKLFVGREFRIKELRDKIKVMEQILGDD